MWRSAELCERTSRAEAPGREHMSGRLLFRPVEEASCFVRTPAGLLRPDARYKLDVYQERGAR